MSQKDYIFKIVESLLKKENHIRALAKDLKTNQTTISRKVEELYTKNIVDYKHEGRNKVYYLKNTLESFQMIVIVESYKLIDLVSKYSHLRKIIHRIKQNKRIKLAVLFGSYAKDMATGNSDIDIFIETNNKEIKKYIENIDSRISAKIGKFNIKSLIAREITKNHVILKGVELYYERLGFFEKN